MVCDLAVAAADLLSGRDGGLELVPEVLAGYDSVTPLEPGELALLADLMAARCAAAVLITAWRTSEQGWAPEVDGTAHRWLETMLGIGLDELTAGFTTAVRAGSPPRRDGARPSYARRSTEDLLAARQRSLGRQQLSYARPLHLVGGRGVFLEAADGRRYLDAYNWPRSTPTAATSRRRPSSSPSACWRLCRTVSTGCCWSTPAARRTTWRGGSRDTRRGPRGG
jgi:hypothetical protein